MPTSVMASWLKEYNAWFLRKTGIDKGQNLHLLSGRFVAVAEVGLEYAIKLREVAAICHACHISFFVTVSLGELPLHEAEMECLSFILGLTDITFHVPPGCKTIDWERANRWIIEVARRRIGVHLSGPVDVFLENRILADPTINKYGLDIVPRDYESRDQGFMRTDPVRGCYRSFHLHIDHAGRIFPCDWLVGIKAACMGSVFEKLTDTVLEGRPYSLDLNALRDRSPEFPPESVAPKFKNCPLTCALHRQALRQEQTGLSAREVG